VAAVAELGSLACISMRSKGANVANVVMVALALTCFVIALSCDRQYGQAHFRVRKAQSEASRLGVDFAPRTGDLVSPEIYYRRAAAVRQWAFPICILGLLVATVTRKWPPTVAHVAILLLTTLTGGVRL
jgi:ABC-type enterochelin transport system permease subunit